MALNCSSLSAFAHRVVKRATCTLSSASTVGTHPYHIPAAQPSYSWHSPSWASRVFTTRPPAVTDVLGSGRNVGALRPGRRVGFL